MAEPVKDPVYLQKQVQVHHTIFPHIAARLIPEGKKSKKSQVVATARLYQINLKPIAMSRTFRLFIVKECSTLSIQSFTLLCCCVVHHAK